MSDKQAEIDLFDAKLTPVSSMAVSVDQNQSQDQSQDQSQQVNIPATLDQTSSEFLKSLLEAILMASEVPLSLREILSILEGETYVESDIIRALFELEHHYRQGNGGIELVEVASGWRFQVPERFAPWVGKLFEARQQRYSTAFFETIALIAYQQPVTRGDIEAVRGVAVSSNIIKTLEDREWIKVVGRKETPGRPLLYGTTEQFLDDFNLKSLKELPPLPALETLFKELAGEEEGEDLVI